VPHRGAWYESPRPRHGGFVVDETWRRATPRHAEKKRTGRRRAARRTVAPMLAATVSSSLISVFSISKGDYAPKK
jgi:hypothetical protein